MNQNPSCHPGRRDPGGAPGRVCGSSRWSGPRPRRLPRRRSGRFGRLGLAVNPLSSWSVSFVSDPTTSTESGPSDHEVVVIGAGPAGLTAAYMLSKRGVASTVLEADTVVGGISRTAVRDGWRFDIGGHRFFTKVKPVNDLWFEILGKDEFLRRPRMSRIYYRKKFYDYPINAKNALDEPRPGRSGAVHGLVRLGAGEAAEGQEHPRRLRRVALRLAPLRALLQDPEREGLGRSLHRDPGRLGCAAHQGPLDLARGRRRAHAEEREGAAGQGQADHQPDRGVQLPEVRPGADVGEVHRARHREGHQGRVRVPRHQDRARRRQGLRRHHRAPTA